MRRQTGLRVAVWVLAIAVMPTALAATPAPTPAAIQAELANTFRSYTRDLRQRPRADALTTCAPDRHCLAEYFSKRYLASFAQGISDQFAEGRKTVTTTDPLDLRLGVAKVHEYAAATTAPLRAVLTIAGSDANGICLPLIRIRYYQESRDSLLWRIDGVEHDSSVKQCDSARTIDTF